MKKSTYWRIAPFGIIGLGLLFRVFINPSDPPNAALFIGRFHSMIVHFPIGLLLLAVLLESACSGIPHWTFFLHDQAALAGGRCGGRRSGPCRPLSGNGPRLRSRHAFLAQASGDRDSDSFLYSLRRSACLKATPERRSTAFMSAYLLYCAASWRSAGTWVAC